MGVEEGVKRWTGRAFSHCVVEVHEPVLVQLIVYDQPPGELKR
jgi:hypothetical protein